jgi:hypothetical protein
MPSWLAIAVPYLPEIIHLARPLFTGNKNQDKGPDIVAQQISELQSAVTENVDSIAKLAAEMQKTIDALQMGAEALEKKLRYTHIINIVAITMAGLAFCMAAYALAQ